MAVVRLEAAAKTTQFVFDTSSVDVDPAIQRPRLQSHFLTDLNQQESQTETTLVGICTYNEAENILDLLSLVREALPATKILVVDDDSPDGTADIVRELASGDPGVGILVRQGQRGLGGATLAAINHAIDGGFEYFLNLDGDLSHSPADLPRLLEMARSKPGVDVVIGSRYVEGGQIVGWPRHRRAMSAMVNRFAIACLRLPVNDCSGSIRCYRVSALAKLDQGQLKCAGYALLEELLVRLKQGGSSMAEVPITFTDRTRGTSKLTFREALRSAAHMIRLAFSS